MRKMKYIASVFLSAVLMLSMVLTACAAVEDTGFSDVAADAWYTDAVNYVSSNGIMNGTGAAAFSPEQTMTRAMLVTVLYRMAGSPTVEGNTDFTDVTEGAWCADAVAWASANGIAAGYSDGRFGTNAPISREQIAAILWRYDGSEIVSASSSFSDASAISSYASAAAAWAAEKGIITGLPDGSFAPAANATRGQVAVMIHRYLTGQRDSVGTDESILIAYFSRAGENWQVGTVEKGNTQIIAEMIAEQTGGTLFHIETAEPYPEDYAETVQQAQQEQAADARPALAADITNWEDYDTVFLGYPIWSGDMPMAVYTFMESHDWTGKRVIPFNTHGGSGQAGTVASIRGVCTGAAVEDGIAITGTTAQNDRENALAAVEEWLLGLGFPLQAQASTEAAGEFNLQTGTVLLNNGIEMPVLGIGTYTLTQEEAENSVYWALRDGFRLIDTAHIYGNEEGVGRGIRRAIDEGLVTREEIFVTTKMWTSDYSNGDAAINESLERLGLDYIDLMILHHSQPSNDVEAYQAMEAAVADGRLRSIGLSNYYEPEDFDRLVNAVTITPALLQNETHPYHQSTEMKEHLAQYGTVLESWYPLGGRGHTQELFSDPTIAEIAEAHNKSSAQVILRWHLQAGNIAIPGSSNEDHIQEDFEIFDFALTDEEMTRMAALDKNERNSSY